MGQTFDMSNILPLLLLSKQGKSNLSGINSMANYLDNPFVGLLTGSFDPLSQQQQNVPEMETYNSIANNPEEAKSVLEVAKQIVDEDKPYYQVAHFIDNNLADFGGYLPEDLKNIARTLESEKKTRNNALANSKMDMFGKAGLPNITERYSDNPNLVQFNDIANDYTSRLVDQAMSLMSQAEQQKKTARFKGRQTTTGYSQKDLLKAMGKEGWTSDTPAFQTVSKLKADERGLLTGANLDQVKQLLGKNLTSDYELRKVKPKTIGPKASQKEYGDLSDPEALANYFAIQSKIQSANKLAKQALDYKSGIINQVEAQGRTPLMDTLAKRVTNTRKVTG